MELFSLLENLQAHSGLVLGAVALSLVTLFVYRWVSSELHTYVACKAPQRAHISQWTGVHNYAHNTWPQLSFIKTLGLYNYIMCIHVIFL